MHGLYKEMLMSERKNVFRFSALALAAALCLLFGVTARGQSAATLQGTVTDQQGAVVFRSPARRSTSAAPPASRRGAAT
jgi:hypothetical protein